MRKQGFGPAELPGPRVSYAEEKITTQLAETKTLYKANEAEKAAAGFKFVKKTAGELWRSGVEPVPAVARLQVIEADAQMSLGWALLSCFKRDKAHQAFHEGLALAKEYRDRSIECQCNIGLAGTYASKDRDDPRKMQYCERALELATEVFNSAKQAFEEGAHPLMIPPFYGDGNPDMDNTLRNKIFIGETKTPRELEVYLAKAQALMRAANQAHGKVRYGR